MPSARGAQGIEDLETALRLQPTSAALAKDRAEAIAALMAAEGLTPPTTTVRVPVTSAGQDPEQLAGPRSGNAAEAVDTGMHISASRRIGADSNGSGSEGERTAESIPASGAGAAAQPASCDAQRSSAVVPAGNGIVMNQQGSTTAVSPVSAPAVTADVRMRPAQPDQSPAHASAENGGHAARPPLVAIARSEASKQQSDQAAGAAARQPTAVSSKASVPQPAAAVQAVAAAKQLPRVAALRPPASGASCLPKRNSHGCQAAAQLQTSNRRY